MTSPAAARPCSSPLMSSREVGQIDEFVYYVIKQYYNNIMCKVFDIKQYYAWVFLL